MAVEPDKPATYTEDQVEQMRERIRLEEREKLRKQLEQEAQARATAEADARKRAEELDTLRKSVKPSEQGSTVDIPKLIDEVTAKARTSVEESFKSQLQSLDSEVKTLKADRDALRIDNYRKDRILKLKGEGTPFIEELVTGRTPEEIEASILAAQEAHKRYFAKSAATPQSPQPAPVVPATLPQGPTPVADPAQQAQQHATPSAATGTPVAAILEKLAAAKTTAEKQRLYKEHRELLQGAAEELAPGSSVLVS